VKIRQGFVSNSSSSSFILKMGNLTDKQIKSIEKKMKYYRTSIFNVDTYIINIKSDSWSCSELPGEIYGDTHIDNGHLEQWFEEIGILKTEYKFFDQEWRILNEEQN
jgi:hypothetical protein